MRLARVGLGSWLVFSRRKTFMAPVLPLAKIGDESGAGKLGCTCSAPSEKQIGNPWDKASHMDG